MLVVAPDCGKSLLACGSFSWIRLGTVMWF